MWPLGVTQRPLIECGLCSRHQVAGINRLWSRQWRCVAKPAILYAHFWPIQAHTNTDQQLRAATRSCNCFSIVSPFPCLTPSRSTVGQLSGSVCVCVCVCVRVRVSTFTIFTASPNLLSRPCCILQREIVISSDNSLPHVWCSFYVHCCLKLALYIYCNSRHRQHMNDMNQG